MIRNRKIWVIGKQLKSTVIKIRLPWKVTKTLKVEGLYFCKEWVNTEQVIVCYFFQEEFRNSNQKFLLSNSHA